MEMLLETRTSIFISKIYCQTYIVIVDIGAIKIIDGQTDKVSFRAVNRRWDRLTF